MKQDKGLDKTLLVGTKCLTWQFFAVIKKNVLTFIEIENYNNNLYENLNTKVSN